MESVLQAVAVLAVFAGTAFSVLGVLGYIRMPDVYTRLHTVGKVGVFGAVLLLVGAIVWSAVSVGKGLVLIALLLLSGPVTAHAMASAAYRIGIPMRKAIRDGLANPSTSRQDPNTGQGEGSGRR